MSIAERCIIKTDENPDPKYNFIEGDEVWIVLDVDKDKDESRAPKIVTVKEKCENTANWHLAQSNPCFEVWLYYHFHQANPDFENSDKCIYWKRKVNDSVKGGFDSRKHPIYIEDASRNAQINFELIEHKPNIGCTNIYELANTILPLIRSKIENVLNNINEQ